MDRDLYEAIAGGDIAMLEQIQLDRLYQTTHLHNTALHVAVQFEREDCVEEILRRCPSLLLNTNNNGDTALHLAARPGKSDIVRLLFHFAKKFGREDIESREEEEETVLKQLLRTANIEKNTALHEAVRRQDLQVVSLLAEADPEFQYSANSAQETPLYLAAVNQYSYLMVELILETFPSMPHGGPNGKTALHAAVIRMDSVTTEILLERKPGMIKEADDNGRTSLHYAAHINCGPDIVFRLLECDKSLAYTRDKNGMSALHLAASKGNADIIQMLIQHCPDCWEVLNKRGQNWLHIVAAQRHSLKDIMNTFTAKIITKELLNQPDKDGNTPLHIAAISEDSDIFQRLSSDIRVDLGATNKEHLTARNILNQHFRKNKDENVEKIWNNAFKSLRPHNFPAVRSQPYEISIDDIEEPLPWSQDEAREREQQREKIKDQIQKVSDSHLVVAALIATVTFSSGLTVPGGYKNDGPDEGMAALIRETAFKAFVILNTIAMLLSSIAVLVHFLMKLFLDDHDTGNSLLTKGFLLHGWCYLSHDVSICNWYICSAKTFTSACHHNMCNWMYLFPFLCSSSTQGDEVYLVAPFTRDKEAAEGKLF